MRGLAEFPRVQRRVCMAGGREGAGTIRARARDRTRARYSSSIRKDE